MTNLLVLLILPFVAGLTLAQSPHKALAALFNFENSINIGNVTFTQTSPDSKVTVMGTIKGLNANVLRGMHIHESANFTSGCNSTGAHFNPTKMTHGDRTDAIRHVGDLGNVRTDGNGTATFNFTVDMVSLFTNSTNSVVGRALIVHSGEDDLGRGGQVDSNTTGHAGGRFACGPIQVTNT